MPLPGSHLLLIPRSSDKTPRRLWRGILFHSLGFTATVEPARASWQPSARRSEELFAHGLNAHRGRITREGSNRRPRRGCTPGPGCGRRRQRSPARGGRTGVTPGHACRRGGGSTNIIVSDARRPRLAGVSHRDLL